MHLIYTSQVNVNMSPVRLLVAVATKGLRPTLPNSMPKVRPRSHAQIVVIAMRRTRLLFELTRALTSAQMRVRSLNSIPSYSCQHAFYKHKFTDELTSTRSDSPQRGHFGVGSKSDTTQHLYANYRRLVAAICIVQIRTSQRDSLR